MDRDTGKVNWQVKLKEPLSGAVGAGGGRVMVGTLNGAMITLDENDGSELWRTQVSSEVLAPPQTNGDIVVVQSQDDKLVALDISTGEQRWIYESSLPVLTVRGHSTPVVTLHRVYAGLASGRVVALDARNGLPVWEQRIRSEEHTSELQSRPHLVCSLLLEKKKSLVLQGLGGWFAFGLNDLLSRKKLIQAGLATAAPKTARIGRDIAASTPQEPTLRGGAPS